jgi:hypothetical protein
MTLEVARAAMEVGLDLLSMPSHTSHALQSLDVVVFKPFKQYLCGYYNFWMSRNMEQPATKETLPHCISLALQKALSSSNIQSGFQATRVFPLNKHVVDK